MAGGSIGIDASRLTVAQRTGTETYTAELLNALAELQPPDEIILYLNALRPPPWLPRIGLPRCIPFPRFWTHARLSWEMIRRPPVILFVPAHVVPLKHPRSVVTVHDLGYLHEPGAHPSKQRRMLDLTTRWSVRAATRVVAISDATKRDLIAHYDVPSRKIVVIPHGVSERFVPAPQDEVMALRRRLSLPARFLLAVGTIQPRKNLSNMARAVELLADVGIECPLLIAGKRGWMADEVTRDLAPARERGLVRFLGFVPDTDLPALYSAATVVPFVSRYEGFGLPALEAMACGTPVVVSDRGALPEVAGDAAPAVDPDDPLAIANAVRPLLADEELHARAVAAGRLHAAQYSWRRTAKETLTVLREVRDTST